MEKERTATTTGKTRRPDLMNDPWTLGPSQGQLQLRPDQCAVHRRSGQKGWLERKIQGLQRWQRKGAPEIEFPRNWDVLTV